MYSMHGRRNPGAGKGAGNLLRNPCGLLCAVLGPALWWHLKWCLLEVKWWCIFFFFTTKIRDTGVFSVTSCFSSHWSYTLQKFTSFLTCLGFSLPTEVYQGFWDESFNDCSNSLSVPFDKLNIFLWSLCHEKYIYKYRKPGNSLTYSHWTVSKQTPVWPSPGPKHRTIEYCKSFKSFSCTS